MIPVGHVESTSTFTWRISSRDDSFRVKSNLQAELSCSVHPGLSLLHEFILDNTLVSEKVAKIVNFEEHDVLPRQEPRKV